MAGNTNAESAEFAFEAAVGEVAAGRDDGDGAGEEVAVDGAGLVGERDVLLGGFLVGDGDGNGFAGGAAFVGEEFGDAVWIGGVGETAVDGFGGGDNETAGAQSGQHGGGGARVGDADGFHEWYYIMERQERLLLDTTDRYTASFESRICRCYIYIGVLGKPSVCELATTLGRSPPKGYSIEFRQLSIRVVFSSMMRIIETVARLEK